MSLLQVIIMWAGLMRGAVSVALAFKQVCVACMLVSLMELDVLLTLQRITCLLQFTSSGVTGNPLHATMITSTIVVVLFSTLVRHPSQSH